jgi:hypothetical protein
MIDALSSFVPSASNGINSRPYHNAQGNNSFEALLAGITNNNNHNVQKMSKKSNDNNDEILKFIQNILLSIDNSLENIGFSSAKTKKFDQVTNPIDVSIDTKNTTDFESILSSGGPLPSFLHEMDVRLHLDATQRQALRDIANENKDVNKTPDVVQKIAMELQRAGI